MQEKLTAKLAKVVVGDPQKEETTMGALASIKQNMTLQKKLLNSAKMQNCFGGNDSFTFNADHPEKALFRSNFIGVRTAFTSDECSYHGSFRSGMYTHAISKH